MISTGILLYRQVGEYPEFFLVHPGGTFFKNKDNGWWTIPKGLPAPGEDLKCAALREFEEETGIALKGNITELGNIRQKGGKVVYAWAFESNLPDGFILKSNTFKIEWPPKSGMLKEFPEIDRAEFFPVDIARMKINPAQVEFIDRLLNLLESKK